MYSLGVEKRMVAPLTLVTKGLGLTLSLDMPIKAGEATVMSAHMEPASFHIHFSEFRAHAPQVVHHAFKVTLPDFAPSWWLL